ncbi:MULTISPECIES: hypothetical protein [unclassified Mycobacterium]|uniref:hypothetical protein n=1 Tax=unclassified Mycobacterium TaxID=2642494 RepID=UPI0029C75F08|nr:MULTISPECIES: hypothetical protein [unclassified Mycobacterium]
MSPTRALSSAFGLLMVAAVALQADAPALIAALAAAVAVVASVQFPSAATVAVLVCVGAIGLSDASPLLCVLAGLNATCYLLLHVGGRASITGPTIACVLVASALGLVATTIPTHLPWVPLAAPLAVFGLFVIVVQPLRLARRAAQSRGGSWNSP